MRAEADLEDEGISGPPGGPSFPGRSDPLLQCLLEVGRWHGVDIDPTALLAGLPVGDKPLSPELFLRAATRAGFHAHLVKRRLRRLPASVLPAVILLKDNRAGVLLPGEDEELTTKPRAKAADARLVIPGDPAATNHAAAVLRKNYSGFAILIRPGEAAGEAAVHETTRPDLSSARMRHRWFWRTMWGFRRYYGQLLPASLLVNFFALAMPFFIMLVYDRVVPNDAVETLWVLAIGAATIFTFEYLIRLLRGYVIERAGREIDQALSSLLFEQLLAMEMRARPSSPGLLAGRVKGYEMLREFFMSATMLALADLPFGLLMIGVIFFIGGPVGWVLVITGGAAVLIGLLNQVPLRQAIRNSATSNVERQAFISETINGLETVKGCHAEGKLQHRLETMMHDASANEVRSHWFAIFGTSTTSFLIHLTTIGVVVVSVYRIQAGEMSMGGMIACVLLGARSLAPLAMVSSLMTRLQQSLEALRGLNVVMDLPRETDAEHHFVNRSAFEVHYHLRDVALNYPGQVNPALQHLSLEITPGERVGVLGRIGSGKSSLLRLLAKLYDPTTGTVLLDGIELRQYHPAALRRVIGYLPQDPTLFSGSLRDNILLGADATGDDAVLKAARRAGLESMINQQVDGIHHLVGERGSLLSGGQRQAVALARALVTEPRCLLLDEPTASMDPQAEKHIIQSLREYLGEDPERSLILVTHKQSMLEVVDRLIVIEGGRIAANGEKEAVLGELRQGKAGGPGDEPPASKGLDPSLESFTSQS